jgi:hypothetical protein
MFGVMVMIESCTAETPGTRTTEKTTAARIKPKIEFNARFLCILSTSTLKSS